MQVATSLLVLLSLMTLAKALPKSKTQQIMLQVEPELLKDHKLVLTIEPLSDTETNPGATKGDEDVDSSATSGEQKAEEDAEDEEAGNPTPSTVPEDTPTTTKKPNTISTRVKPISGFFPGVIVDNSESQFLLNLPDVKCPPGQRPDASGICRTPFGSFGMERSLRSGGIRFFKPARGRPDASVLDPKRNELVDFSFDRSLKKTHYQNIVADGIKMEVSLL